MEHSLLENMSSENECTVCGSPLAGGVCAVCLLGVGLEEGMDDDLGEVDLVAERPGDVVGRYLLVEKAGEGGFGVVFRAEQQAPMKRVVAVKIIKPGMDSVEVVTRFGAERQALALMDHPHIAKVYDAGTTPRGRPFFVMEYVEGYPLTEFCDVHQLPMRERLELFAEVCRAVQHAHQKGIIHRDLKPGNVLVGKDVHGKVSPKVIDFGVAKAISIELTDKTFFTVFGRMMGTPQYMSPEQTELNAVDVDTRSDIYSLGVLLYELVTGHVPIGKDKLTSATFDQMRKMIREEEPLKPSVRVGNLSEGDLEEAARLRGIDASRFRRYLAGDLDWVVMKALEKDRGRRYETAQGLANDIVNFLEDLPVTAGPPGAGYRVRKFAHRHRGPVIATLLALMVLLVGSIGITKGYFMVREEKVKVEDARASEVEQKNKKEYEHLKLIVEEVWNRREAQPGTREDALSELGKVGGRDLAAIDLGDVEARTLRESARDAMLACMLWTDLHRRPLWTEMDLPWAPAALDREQRHGVVAVGNGGLQIRAAESGEVLATREGGGKALAGPLRFDPLGELVAVGFGAADNWELVMWNWKEGKEVSGVRQGVNGAFDFHPDGESYAVGDANGDVNIYLRDGTPSGVVLDFSEKPVALRYAPEGDRIVVGLAGGSVAVVEVDSAKVIREWPGMKVSSLTWAPEGAAIAVGTRDGAVLVLDVATGDEFKMQQSHSHHVEQITWSHDGRLIASGSRDEIRLWDGRQRLLLCDFPAWARTLEFSADDSALGPITPENDEHALEMLDVDRSAGCWASVGHPGHAIMGAAWVLDGAVLVTAAEDGLRYWNRQGTQLLHEADYRLVAGGIAGRGGDLYLAEEGRIRHSKLAIVEGRLRVTPAAEWPVVEGGRQIVLSPDGKILAVAHDDEVVLVETADGKSAGASLKSLRSTSFVTMSPDGVWLAAGTRGGSGVRLWNLSAPGAAPVDLPVKGSATVAFFPIKIHPEKGPLPTMLLTGDATAYRLWVKHPTAGWVEQSKHPNDMVSPGGKVARMAFSPRGTVVVTTFGRKYLQILHPTKLVVKAQPRFDKQWPLTMSPDGRILATEATNGRMFIWNLEVARRELDERGLDWEEFDPFEPDVVPLLQP